MEHRHQQQFCKPICPDVPIVPPNGTAWNETHNYEYFMAAVPQQPFHFVPPKQYIAHSPYFVPSAPACLHSGNHYHEFVYTEAQPQCLPTVINLQQQVVFSAPTWQWQGPRAQQNITPFKTCSLGKRKRIENQYPLSLQYGARGLHRMPLVMIPASQQLSLNLHHLPVFKIPTQKPEALPPQPLLQVIIPTHQQPPLSVQQLPVVNFPVHQQQAPPLTQLPLLKTAPQQPLPFQQALSLQQGSTLQQCALPPLQKRPFKKVSLSENAEELVLLLQPGLELNKKYGVVCIIGEGAFGKVVECIDHKNGVRVAVKIIKASKKKHMLALHEVSMLKTINSLDPEKKFAFVKMLEWFEHNDHVCIVFELLGISTHDFLYKNGRNTFTVKQIRHMADQVFRAMNLIHLQKIVHTDLKPDNILFVDSGMKNYIKIKQFTRILQNLDVKVADFGNAVHLNKNNTGLVTTQPYRAPEVILGLGWNGACDVWSLGCVLLEYYLGFPMFQALDNKTHLDIMEKVLGPIPTHMLQNRRKKDDVLDDIPSCDEHSRREQCNSQKLQTIAEYMLSSTSDHMQLFDLLQKMLAYDPSKRITLEEAVKHPFFRSQ